MQWFMGFLFKVSDSINLLDNLRRRAIFAQKSIFEKIPGINGGTSSLASKKANSSGFLFWNVESSSISTTLIVEKIDKIEILIIDGKVTLLEDEGKLLEKVDSLGDHDSKDEVASVDNEMTNFLALKKVGYGTNSLLE
ncbi:hypothetical protein Tco_0359091 [Tanacetum coccineum]